MERVVCGMHTLDIAACFDPCTPRETLAVLALQLSQQFAQLGFLYVTAPESEAVLAAFECARDFFAQPEETKATGFNRDRAKRGYSPLYSENFGCLNGESTPNDVVEKFRVGPRISEELAEMCTNCKLARTHFSENTWPVQPEGMQETSYRFYNYMEQVMLALAKLFEIALKVPEGFFASRLSHHTSILSYNHYPPYAEFERKFGSKEQLRIAEHTDVSLFTIVTQSAGDSGLEIQTPDGWLLLPPRPNTFLVNVGDCLMDWTNGAWKSTKHRVVFPRMSSSVEGAPDSEEPNAFTAEEGHRYSLVFFVGLNYDATMHPIRGSGSCDDVTEATQELSYNEWRKRRVRRAMDQMKRQGSKSNS